MNELNEHRNHFFNKMPSRLKRIAQKKNNTENKYIK